MDKYSKYALKITFILCTSLFGLLFLFAFVKASPPSGYDYGRKQAIYHEWFGLKWALYNYLAVDYTNPTGDYIIRWTTTGSGPHIYAAGWITYGYSYSTQTSDSVGGYYTWVKFMNQAYFETTDGVHRGLASAWNIIYVSFQFSGDAAWTQYTPWFIIILKWNHPW